jgi:site-specific DNA recombinase
VEAVQRHLRSNAASDQRPATSALASPLAGRVFDADGEPLYAHGAAKGGRRYRYYISRSLVNGSTSTSDDRKGWRLSAPELERAVTLAAQQILSDRAGLLEVIDQARLNTADIRDTIDLTAALCRRLQDESETRSCLAEIIDRVELCDDGMRVALKLTVPCSHAGIRADSTIGLTRFVTLALRRRGVETRLVLRGSLETSRPVDPALLKAVSRARVWFDELASGKVRALAEIAKREGIKRRYVQRLAHLAFVAPSVVEAISRGQQPAELSAEALLNRIDLPPSWAEQEQVLGFV